MCGSELMADVLTSQPLASRPPSLQKAPESLSLLRPLLGQDGGHGRISEFSDIIKSYKAVTGSIKGGGHEEGRGARTYQRLYGGRVVKSAEVKQSIQWAAGAVVVAESHNHMLGCKGEARSHELVRTLDRGIRIKKNNLTSHLNGFTFFYNIPLQQL